MISFRGCSLPQKALKGAFIAASPMHADTPKGSATQECVLRPRGSLSSTRLETFSRVTAADLWAFLETHNKAGHILFSRTLPESDQKLSDLV